MRLAVANTGLVWTPSKRIHLTSNGPSSCLLVTQPLFTGPQEEREAAHEAFMHAMESSKPLKLRMPGMQQFAAAVSPSSSAGSNCWPINCRTALGRPAVTPDPPAQ